MLLQELLLEITYDGEYDDAKIAEYTGISVSTLYRIRHGKARQANYQTYVKLFSFYLAIKIPNPPNPL